MAPSAPVTSTARATAIGTVAILLWACLALLATGAGAIPPFETVAISFAVAFLLCLGKWLLFRESIASHLRQPGAVWLLGVGGLFGYHFFYFLALKTAPPVEANLINYLWPLLITTDESMATTVIGIKRMINTGDALTEWNLVMATAMLALLPPALVVLLMQKWFVRGLVETEK